MSSGEARIALAQDQRPQDVSVRVQTPVYKLDGAEVGVPGYMTNDQPGAPRLPLWNTVVELPPEGGWRIEYRSPGNQLLAQPVDVLAAPVPDVRAFERFDSNGNPVLPVDAPTVDQPDPSIYAVDAFYPASPVVAGAEQWQRGRRLLALRVFPFQYNPVTRQLRYHPDLHITVHLTPSEPTRRQAGDYAGFLEMVNEPASTSGALRIRTAGRSMVRLTYDDLQAAGVPLANVAPASLALFYLGEPVAIEVTGDGDGSFDPGDLVIFYAQPYQGRYQSDNVFWFTYGGQPGLRMATRTVTPTGSEPRVTTITRTLHVEIDAEYRTIFPRPQDADHWFDTPLSPDDLTTRPVVTRTYELALVDPLPAGSLRIQAALHGGADRPANPDKSIAITLNSHPVATHQWEGMTYYVSDDSAPAAWLDGAPNRIHLTAATAQLPGIEFYSVSPDWVRVTYPSLASAQEDKLYIEALALGANQVTVSGFTTPDVLVYDLRDPNDPVRLLTTAAAPTGGVYDVSFWDADLPDPTYYLSSQGALAAPLAIEPDTPSNWRTPDHTADYIAVVHPSLWNAIDPLLDYRAAQGLRVAKVDVQDIYDEWSYGRRDPEAIRSFLTYAYRCWNGGPCAAPPAMPPDPPQYVLLVGDGHYDFTGVSGTTFPNLIPPYLVHVDPWLGEALADNRYVSADGPDDFLPDMAIGRIPANVPADVEAVTAKTIAYETLSPTGPWQERVVFVADRNVDPAGDFHALSDHIRLQWLPGGYDDRTMYYLRDYTTGPEMRAAVRSAFNDDTLLIQWFGHSSRYQWGSFVAFNVYDPPTLDPNDSWPITTHYTCYSGYFANLAWDLHSLGEVLVGTPLRGAVADFSSAGANLGNSLLVLNAGLTQAIFRDRIDPLGQSVDAAKLYYFENSGGLYNVIDTYILFGDPALKLRLPDAQLADSTLAANRDWVPPGQAITVTATLTSTAAVSTTAQLTLTLPAELGDPTALSATSSNAIYDPVSRQVTWNGVVTTGTNETVTFSSVLVPDAAACSPATVVGQARDDLAALTALSTTVQPAVPDVDCDNAVDIVDIQQVTARWGAAQGEPLYHPRYDLNGDNQIDLLDVVVVAETWQ